MPRHTSKTRALRALGLLAITLAVGSPTVVEANGPDSADTNAFPRCQLDAIQRDQFHQRYGAGHLAMAQGNLSKAQLAFEDALRLCVDDEVLWFLSIVHEDMGEKETANRYRASWVMQRRLYGLDETPPTGATKWTAEAKTPEKPTPTPERFGRRPPSDLFPIADKWQLPSYNLDAAENKAGSELYHLPLRERSKSERESAHLDLFDGKKPARRPAPEVLAETFGKPPTLSPVPGNKQGAKAQSHEREDARRRSSSERAKVELNLNTTPSGAQVHINGVLVGQTPLRGMPVVAEKHYKIVIEKDGYHRLERELYVSPGANQHLFLNLRPK